MIKIECVKYTDCNTCRLYEKGIFHVNSYPKGTEIMHGEYPQHVICFLLEGEIQIDSHEHPGTILHEGQFILQPKKSAVKAKATEPVQCVLYTFDELLNICNDRFNKGISMAKSMPIGPVVLDMCHSLKHFLNTMAQYLNHEMRCAGFLNNKESELIYILNCFYPIRDLSAFFSTIYKNSNDFHAFVMQNYQHVKDVEAFAQLGGYTVSTFRRVFKETFGEPAYQWMLKKRCQDIQNDLMSTNTPISDICFKYGFETLSNFSHFCRTNFGQSPRVIRSEKGEKG